MTNPFRLSLYPLSLVVLCAACFASQTIQAQMLPPIVHVLATDPEGAEEGSDPARFAVIRIGPVDQPLEVHYSLGGTASNGVDYLSITGSVTIPAWQFFANVDVSPVDDYRVEGWESVVLALQQPPVVPPSYIVAWPSVAVAYIEDNDWPATNSPPFVAMVNPPDGAEFQAPVDIKLVAKAGDRDGRIRTVEFFDGTNSLGVVTNQPWPAVASAERLAFAEETVDPSFSVDGDSFVDADAGPIDPSPIHLFRLAWENVPPEEHRLTAVATDNEGASTMSEPIRIKVLPPPTHPVAGVEAVDPEAMEPDPTNDVLDVAIFRIKRTGGPNIPLTVYYRLGGAAQNGEDYEELPYSVVIPENERFVDVLIKPIDDNLVEGDESVVQALVEPPCIAIFPPPPDCYRLDRSWAARCVIHDNDTPPHHPPLVRLVRPEDGQVFLSPVDIRLAAMARDLDGRVVSVEFFECTNSLGVVSNNVSRAAEVQPPFGLVWSNVPPGRYVLTAVATDDEGVTRRSSPVEIKVLPPPHCPIVNIVATDPVASEPGVLAVVDNATFQVHRTGDMTHSLRVNYLVRGTAENGVDYDLLSGHVIIPDGSPSAEITLHALDDDLVEGPETVVLRLVPPLVDTLAADWTPSCYWVGPTNRARAVIRDNDFPPTNLPPHIEIVRPENGEIFRAFSDILLYVNTADRDGWVRTVEFFANGNSLGVVSNSLVEVNSAGEAEVLFARAERIFRLLWENVPAGGYELTARATDNDGASTLSDPVKIRVIWSHPTVVTIEATDPFATEGPFPPWIDANKVAITYPLILDTATFTISRRGPTNEALTVYYRLSGTAENEVDYEKLSGKATIPAGVWSTRVEVVPIDDDLPEKTETVSATLLPVLCPAIFPPPPDCYVIGNPDRAQACIRDNDFTQSPNLEIVQPADGAVFREFADIKIGVVTRDPDGWVSRMEFFANDKLIGEQQINYIIAPPPGQVQTFSMIWSNVPAGDYKLMARATDNQGAKSVSDPIVIHVRPLPQLPVVTIESVDSVGSEQSPVLAVAPDVAVFKVRRTGALIEPLAVFYRISGSAGNGVDYDRLSGELHIPAGEASSPIVVVPIDDNLVEGTESVIVSLSQPPCVLENKVSNDGCYLVGDAGRAIAYIRDNDSEPNRPPKVALINPPVGSEYTAPADLRLIAAAEDPDGWVATVEFFANGRSLGVITNRPWIVEPTRLPELMDTAVASPASDLVAPIPMPNPFVLPWLDVSEGEYELTAMATDNEGSSATSHPVKIRVLPPTHAPVVRIIAVDPIAREGTLNTAEFHVRRVGRTNEALTVYYETGGTAGNGVDYEKIANSVVIAEGRRGARVLVEPLDDDIPERIETVVLKLRPSPTQPGSYDVGRPSVAAAIILDNEWPRPISGILPDGRVHVRLDLPQGLPFRVEASDNMRDWEEVAEGLVDSTDGVSFIDGEFMNHAQRFYRAVPDLTYENVTE